MGRPKLVSKVRPTEPDTVKTKPTRRVYLINSILLATALASASLATRLALQPLFGSTSVAVNHSKIQLSVCLLSALVPTTRASERSLLLGLASWLGCAPYTSYAVSRWATRWKNPVLGSCVVELVILAPTLSIGIALIRGWGGHNMGFLPGPMTLKAVVTISSFYYLNTVENWLWAHIPLHGLINSSNIFLAMALVLTICAGSLSYCGPHLEELRTSPRLYKLVLPFLLPFMASLIALSSPPTLSPRLPYTRGTASSYAGRTPSSPATVRILARTRSIAGLTLVGEHVEEGFRFLRVDHSLLGGRWIGDKAVTGGLGDSIYLTFVLQECIRLTDRERPRAERALFIGLGVGVAVEAFISQQINTTVVEIDPAVYKYARKYFGLPEPNQVFLEDAREWLRNHASLAEEDKYDYVVHDCFSGGGVPVHIFTFEFWEELKTIMKKDGVVAINFAGKLGSEPARAIFLTLQKSFGRCRAFHDHFEAEFDDTYAFFNVVFFCMPFSSDPPKFRPAIRTDYLGSHLRRHVFGSFPRREIQPDRVLGLNEEPGLLVSGEDKWILRDNVNHLQEWQRPIAIQHWTVMREVLPDVFWETY